LCHALDLTASVCHEERGTEFGVTIQDDTAKSSWPPPAVVGLLCGAGAALCWAIGLVSALHGISIGLSPLEISLHRLAWAGLVFLPTVRRGGAADIAAVGLGRSIVLTLCGGICLALFSNAGFILVPLGHGGVIQPSCAAFGGLVLATVVLKDKIYPSRIIGGLALVCGLVIIGYEALSTIGVHGILGDLLFAMAGFSFAIFGVLLKLWRITPIRAVAITSVLSLVLIPIQYFTSGFDRLIAVGLYENFKLALLQGLLSGAVATFMFTRAVVLLGAARAAVFPALVPPLTLLIGFIWLGNVPTALQIVGLVMVLIGFRLTQRS
jgi:drug/metabolite transporter (DMT)-like permease